MLPLLFAGNSSEISITHPHSAFQQHKDPLFSALAFASLPNESPSNEPEALQHIPANPPVQFDLYAEADSYAPQSAEWSTLDILSFISASMVVAGLSAKVILFTFFSQTTIFDRIKLLVSPTFPLLPDILLIPAMSLHYLQWQGAAALSAGVKITTMHEG